MTSTPPPSAAEQIGWRAALLILTVFALLLLTYRLDGTPFRGLYDDVDRSLIARNMVDSGDWLVASYVSGPLYTKPPLMYWTAAGIGVLTGRSDELPGNLASVLGMFLAVAATFWAGRTLFGTTAGLRAGLLLITMHLFLAMSRQALLDTVMMGGFALSFGALVHLGFSGTGRPTLWWLVVALGLSLSFMTKGPVILPVFLLIWLPMLPQVPAVRPRPAQILLALGLIALVTVPWPIALMKAAPEAVAVWKSELFGRFGDGQQFHQWTQKPVWFYLPDLINTLPWVLLLPWAVASAIRERRDPRFRMLLWWAAGGFVFFSLASATKRSYYLLPLYPAFALLIAAAWGRFVDRVRKSGLTGSRGKLVPFLTLVLVAALGASFVVLPLVFPQVPKVPFLGFGGLALGLAGWAIATSSRGNWSRVLALAIGGTCCIHLAYFGHFVPAANTFHSGKPFFTEAIALIGEEEVTLSEVPLALSVFYLHGVKWRYSRKDDLSGYLASHPGCLVITRPAMAAEFSHLAPVLERWYAEPFGKEKGLGLYRHRRAQPSS